MPTTWVKYAGETTLPPNDGSPNSCAASRLLEEQPWRSTISWPERFHGGICHRLDRATSGALLVAESVDELQSLRTLFSERRLTKTYLFEAARDVPWDTNAIDRPIAHDRNRKSRMIVQRGRNTPHRGKWYTASTTFSRLEANLWQAVITTGVTHQIRVHAAAIGLALRGDSLYGGGAPIAPDVPFHLHHVGLRGPGLQTAPVPHPDWASGTRLVP